MKDSKKLQLQIYQNSDNNKNKAARETPNLLRIASVHGSEKMTNNKGSESLSSDAPIDESKTDEPKKSDKDDPPPLSQFQLFRYANRFEVGLMILGSICAMGSGTLIPISCVVFGDMVNSIVNEALGSATAASNSTTPNNTAIYDAARMFTIANSILGLAMLILIYMSVMLFNYTSQRQAFRIRQLYLKSVLHQDIAWYDDKMKSGNVAMQLTEDVIKLEEGLGEKVPIFIDHISIVVCSIIFAFSYGWKLTLVCLATLPVTSLVLFIVGRISSALSKKELDVFGEASSIAEEALSAIKTVVAFNGQSSELERYKKNLVTSYKLNVKLGLASGCGFGFLWFGIYISYALSLWYGVILTLEQRDWPIEEREYDAAVIISVFFCTIVAAMNIGVVAPYIETFSVAKVAAANIFSVIERKSTINSLDPDGIKLAGLQNLIEFKNVEFQYPSRPDVEVLKTVSFQIRKGETVALVGSSGCGKSTCIQLLQRFYDPINGQVLLDGHDLRDLNIAWLRSNVGIVSQEPVLFDTSIAENIRYGNLDASMEMIVEAAKNSNAHDFIMKLPAKYDTLVGERGAQISGGQKQRIAIARALIGNPEILLLDEATSALDTRSEKKVQAALDKAHEGRTTIIVAHRLTTIRNASKIIVLSDGNVVEEGKHDELMALNGYYHALVTAQVSEFSDPLHGQSPTNTHVEEVDEDLEPIAIKSEEPDEDSDPKKISKEVGTWKILKLNKPEWKLILIAGLTSIVVGSSMPVFAILFGGLIALLANSDDDYVKSETTMYAIYYTITGLVIGFSTFLQIFVLSIASERLTTRLRGVAFQTMLKQEMAWFDEPSNGVGALCAKLSTEAAAVKGATGQRIGTMMQTMSTLVIAIGIAMYYDWRLALLGMAFIPIILVIAYTHGRVYKKETLSYQKGLEKSTKLAIEAVSNIRTVAGIGREETFYNNYVSAIVPAFEQAKRNTHYRGIVFGLFKSVVFVSYAIVMLYGGYLAQKKEIEFADAFKVCEALIAGTLVIGEGAAFSPNLQKGIIAAGKIIRLVERVPNIQDSKDTQQLLMKEEAELTFKKVSFTYPTRPGVTVLNALNMEVKSGKTIALVGSSGCGKSTVIKLLERFYDPVSGTVNINRTNIASITQSSLRMSLGLVEQEPTIFARTIKENIAYGDNTREVPMEEIIAAAKKANIHNFVTSLPLGYETKLGNKGTMLSGGQKQRVAIARALLKSPKILLLDEATSALDTESEKVVQAALNEAKVGRSCILVAHRLSTVEDADKICVLQQGAVVETGSHEELIQNHGLYYELLCLQNGRKPQQ